MPNLRLPVYVISILLSEPGFFDCPVEEYINKYATMYKGKAIFFQQDRENVTKSLHRFNLFKRLESSVYAFSETIKRLSDKTNKTIELLQKGETLTSEDEELDDGSTLDYKLEIKVSHLRKADYLEDLCYDKEILDGLRVDLQLILENKRDNKLMKLKEIVTQKIKETPYNQGNKKVLIFSAFADTTDYLYFALADELKELGVFTGTVSGSRGARTNNFHLQQEFNNILKAFSPKSKGTTCDEASQISVLIGTDCISEGQNLQDCDCVINYDIHWNPVSLIQRFGRIDRIGSQNDKIQMINFFPNLALNEYLNLEKRIKGKLLSVNIASTGDENILSPEMNDINFRKRQLEKLKDEIVDMEDANDNISLTDLNMNDYLFELLAYKKHNPELQKVARGIFSVTEKTNDKTGVVFCFKHKNTEIKPKSDSSLYPYYLIFIGKDGTIHFGNANAREILKYFRTACYEKKAVSPLLFYQFFKETKDTKDMSAYSNLLTTAVKSIQGQQEENAEQSIFDFGGFNNLFAGETADDFELVDFLVVE